MSTRITGWSFRTGAIAAAALSLCFVSGGARAQRAGGHNKNNTARRSYLQPTGSALADQIVDHCLNDIYEFHDRHFHKGEYNHIVNIFRIVAQAEPWRYELYSDGAYLLWSTDQDSRGIALLKQGLAANPNDYYMYDELGRYYYYQDHDAKTAVGYFEQATRYKCPALTWDGLAHCYEKTHQLDKAVSAWQKCASYSGRLHDVALLNLQRVRRSMANPSPGR
ncbi:MAG TPA: hypothetical protein VGS41_14205 [Chthonomonadales bacterium]|nr:hypothetical protein [Chthonomonadales bacterium]